MNNQIRLMAVALASIAFWGILASNVIAKGRPAGFGPPPGFAQAQMHAAQQAKTGGLANAYYHAVLQAQQQQMQQQGMQQRGIQQQGIQNLQGQQGMNQAQQGKGKGKGKGKGR